MNYFLRSILTALLPLGVGLACLMSDPGRSDQSWGIKYVLGMDLLHDLFTGLIPFCLFCLFFPGKMAASPKTAGNVVLALVSGIFCGAFPCFFLRRLHPDFSIPSFVLAGFFLIGCNCAMLVLLGAQKGPTQKAGRLIKRAVGIADLAFPLAVWSVYRDERGRTFAAARLIPLFQFMVLSMLLGLAAIPDKDFYPPDEATVRPLREYESYFDLQIDETAGRLWASRGSQILTYEWAKPGDGYRTVGGDFLGDGVNTLGFQPESGGCLVAHGAADRLRLTRVDTMTPEKTWEGEFSLDMAMTPGSSMTLWDPPRNILIVVFESGIFRFADNGRRIVRRFDGIVDANSAVMDPKRRLLYVCMSHPGILLALDADTLEIRRHLPIPYLAKRLAVDSVRDRLFVSFPKEGMIRVVDLNRFAVVKTVASILGVRTLRVDENRGVLLAGGFAPYLEIFSLDDFSFRGRIKSPPWLRSIVLSRQVSRGWFSSNYGLWEWDPALLDRSRPARWLERADPFFMAQRVLVLALSFVHRPPSADRSIFKAAPVDVEGHTVWPDADSP